MQTENTNIISKDFISKEDDFEITLRPQNFDDFVGQEKVKQSLKVLTQAAKQRNESLDHILIYGPPGLGKTTLSHIIAKNMNSSIKVTSGPAIERAGDLASILTSLSDKDILFIDEIHRLNRIVEEVLYPAMEDYALDIVVGKGPGAKTLRIDLPKFTLIGATTKVGSLSSPLRDRFGLINRLDFYKDEEIELIIDRSSKMLNIVFDKNALKEISCRSRKTPRIANRLAKRIRDYAQIKNKKQIDKKIINDTLSMLEIDNQGLDKIDRAILTTIIQKYSGGPVGLETIAASIGEDINTICDMYEPYLMQIGFLERTPRGRKATSLAYKHLSIDNPIKQNQKLC